MTTFNLHSQSKSIESNLLNDLNEQLNTLDNKSPMYVLLLRRIEHIEYELHRARTMGARTITTHTQTTPHMEAPMQAPTFSNDLVVRKQQYMEYLVGTGDHSVEEVVLMDMRTLRDNVDEYIVTTIAVRTALPNGGTTTHYIVRKAA